MAIQIEQEQQSVSWVKVASTVVIILVVFLGAYFLFFKSPDLIDVVAPEQFENLQEISNIELNTDELLSSPRFEMLRQFNVDSQVPTPGKSNPFQPF